MTERNPREGIREELRQKIMEQLQECSRMEDDELYEQIDRAIREKGQELFLPLKERLWLRSSLYDSFRRLDILQELLDDRNVTEIMVPFRGTTGRSGVRELKDSVCLLPENDPGEKTKILKEEKEKKRPVSDYAVFPPFARASASCAAMRPQITAAVSCEPSR